MNIPFSKTPFTQFAGRRSVVHSLNGMVACSQPLAATVGQTILAAGGNAADAAVAIAAALNVTEPGSTGIGGDMFCLFYNNSHRKVYALNGSGRSPMNLSLDTARDVLKIPIGETGSIPLNSVLAVTTPGAAAGWIDTVERFGSGKLTMKQILEPAIRLCEEGFPVGEVSARLWQENEKSLRESSPENYNELLFPDATADGGFRAPVAGEVMTNPGLAATFRTLATEGKDGFYRGPIAHAIAEAVHSRGGFLSLSDLAYHVEKGSTTPDPICIRFNDMVDVWEHPPNGQGVVALMALGMLEELERAKKIPSFSSLSHNSADYIHALIEVFRIAFSDACWWVADPEFSSSSHLPDLLSRPYLAQRVKEHFSPLNASRHINHGNSPAFNSCDTVYFSVADKDGNAASFVNSNYHGFGTGIIPHGCGFTLQSRGANFSLESGHPNALAPRKRPYHTIIPAMATNPADGTLSLVFGVMGGFMQPQGHVQLLMNMLIFGMNPQQALDAPRVCIGPVGHLSTTGDKTKERIVYVEEGVEERVLDQLRERGHEIEVVRGWDREIFGRGQIIRALPVVNADRSRRVYAAGSDFRADGMAVPA